MASKALQFISVVCIWEAAVFRSEPFVRGTGRSKLLGGV